MEENLALNEGKRVLVITKNDFRSRMDGGSKRTSALMSALRADGWQVDWVTARPFLWHSESPPLGSLRSRLAGCLLVFLDTLANLSLSGFKWYSFRAASKIREMVAATAYDVVIVEHPQMAGYMRCAKAPDALVDLHNVESDLLANYGRSAGFGFRGIAARLEAHLMRRVERRLARGRAGLITVSEHDAARLRELAPDSPIRAVVAPNGIDEEFFHVTGEPEAKVVFIGHLGWRPNVDGATWLSSQVWPQVKAKRPGLRLVLVGRSPSAEVKTLSSTNIDVVADVPSVLPHLATAACATAPLLSAGGTRIKILEALAAGVPVVATTLGALGLEHLKGDHFVVTDDPLVFADELCKMSGRRFDREALRDCVSDYRWPSTLSPIVEVANTRVIRRAEVK